MDSLLTSGLICHPPNATGVAGAGGFCDSDRRGLRIDVEIDVDGAFEITEGNLSGGSNRSPVAVTARPSMRRHARTSAF